VVGIVDRDGTQFYSHGKISNAINATVDQNTIFAIGSNTKVFTTILLAQMVEEEEKRMLTSAFLKVY